MSRDYVPHSPAQFMVFMQNLIDYANARINGETPVWKNIPPERLDTLTQKFRDFKFAFTQAVSAPTQGNNNTRHEAQNETTRELRGFVNQFLRFPPVNNTDRIEMGIPNHDTIRTDRKSVV